MMDSEAWRFPVSLIAQPYGSNRRIPAAAIRAAGRTLGNCDSLAD
jgi:hypothetical protein